MLPYIALIGVPFIFSFVAKSPKVKALGTLENIKFKIGNTSYIKTNNLALCMFFLILFLLLSLRDVTIGNDTSVYKYYFEQYNKLSFSQLYTVDGDYLYILFNWLVGRLTDNFQTFLIITSTIILWPIYQLYRSNKENAFMKIVLFMNMPIFIMLFSGIRQSIAISIGLIAYKYVKKKKFVPFLLTILIAMGFHHSAFILILLYPIYHIRLNKRSLLFIIPVTAVIYIFNKNIFTIALSVLNTLSNGAYNTSISSTGAVTTIILFSAFLALSYFVTDEAKLDNEMIGLRNILMLALWLQCFVPLHNLAMRFNYYFIIFIPMLMPRIVAYSKPKYRSIAKFAQFIITVYLLFYYCKNTYRACITGQSSLNTYPYVPFWHK